MFDTKKGDNKMENINMPVIVNENEEVTVSGRDLHKFLEIKSEFRIWFTRMSEYGFEENEDYTRVYQKCNTLGGSQNLVDYFMKIDMAKEICMLQRSEKGRQARRYFIELEKKFNSPEAILKRLLDMTNKMKYINEGNLNKNVIECEAVDIDEAEYISKDGELLTNFRDTSKIYGIKEGLFINWLLINNYCYRDKKDVLKPSSKMMDYFVMREFVTENNHKGIQTLINSKGREVFRTLLMDEKLLSDGGVENGKEILLVEN